jgi:ABC-type transport system involved in multi-copper enzyme maturation permease subunit
MNIFPVLRRELAVQARKQTFYFYRSSLAGLGLISVIEIFSYWRNPNTTGMEGQAYFIALIHIGFFLSNAAVLLTCDGIGKEHREGTLGLLFLTPIRNMEVLLGKFGASGLLGLSAILGMIPILMLPVLMGGVTGSEVIRTTLVMLNTLFVALTMGLWISASGKPAIVSVRNAILTMLFLNLVPMMLSEIINAVLNIRGDTFWLPSPIQNLFSAKEEDFLPHPDHFYISLLVIHLIGWLLLFLADRRLQRNLTPPHGKLLGQTESPSTMHSKKVPSYIIDGVNPVSWLILKKRSFRLAAWFLPIPAILGIITNFLHTSSSEGIYWIDNLLSVAIPAWLASSFIVRMTQSGELEILKTTPLGALSILSGQSKALFRLLFWPAITCIVLEELRYMQLYFQYSSLRQISWILFSLPLQSILSLLATCILALWIGSVSSSQRKAIFWALLLCLFVPTIGAMVLQWITIRLMGSPLYPLAILMRTLYFIALIWLGKNSLIAAYKEHNLEQKSVIATFQNQFNRLRHWTPATNFPK